MFLSMWQFIHNKTLPYADNSPDEEKLFSLFQRFEYRVRYLRTGETKVENFG